MSYYISEFSTEISLFEKGFFALAGFHLSLAAMSGGIALADNNDVIWAVAQAKVYQQVGQLEKASQLRTVANNEQLERNQDLRLVGVNLITAAGIASVAAVVCATHRRRELE